MNWKTVGLILVGIWAIGSVIFIANYFIGISTSSIIITILMLLLLTMAYVIFNLYKKMKILETWTSSFISRVAFVDEELERIDAEGSFASDDEVGVIFKEIRKMVDILVELTEGDTLNATQEKV